MNPRPTALLIVNHLFKLRKARYPNLCFGGRFGGDVAVGAGAIVDDYRLLKSLAEFLRDHARDDIGRTTGGKPDDEVQRTLRERLRLCETG